MVFSIYSSGFDNDRIDNLPIFLLPDPESDVSAIHLPDPNHIGVDSLAYHPT